MKRLGTLSRLQIQRDPLKRGERPHRWYDPGPLLAVDRLLLSPRGAMAEVEGRSLVDVHHADHPATRIDPEEQNTLTMGFTSHYRAMRDRFGGRLVDGVAGESLIVDCAAPVRLDEIVKGILIRTRNGSEIHLREVSIARPCVEFSRWALGVESGNPNPMLLKEALRFLDEGMRGFRMGFAGQLPAWVAVGDEVFSLD
jgi:hypothetical protein